MVELNQIYNKSCLDFMEGDLEPESIDLVVTSPPYADMRDYIKIPADEYVDWFLPIAKGIYKALKPNGVFVLNIRNNVVKGKRHTYVYQLVAALADEVGFDLIDDIIWDKGKMLPNTKGKRPMDCWEFAFVFGKGTDVTWNADPNRTPYDERSLARYEAPIKRRWGSSRNEKGDKIVKPHPLGCFPKNILKMGSETTYQGHPAPFPVTFAEWFVKGYSNPGDIVYDPFGGGGTTAVAAQKHGRKWIMTEIHQDYVDLANKRIQDTPEALF
jgi:site-specific DNA-methyltransferase (adenine-specific)